MKSIGPLSRRGRTSATTGTTHVITEGFHGHHTAWVIKKAEQEARSGWCSVVRLAYHLQVRAVKFSKKSRLAPERVLFVARATLHPDIPYRFTLSANSASGRWQPSDALSSRLRPGRPTKSNPLHA